MDCIFFYIKNNSEAYSFLINKLPSEVASISRIGKENVAESNVDESYTVNEVNSLKQITDSLKEKNTLFICNTQEDYLQLSFAGIKVAFWECEFDGAQTLDEEVQVACESNSLYIIQDVDELELADYEHIYNRLHKLPCEILRTKRLIIRETTVADVDAFLELYRDPSITLYMEDLFEPDTEREYQQNYIENIYEFYDIGIWTLVLRNEDGTEGEIVGRMGIEMTEVEGMVEMGFMLGCDYQGHGYATEAGLAILEYAKNVPGINEIRAKVHKENLSSQRLCERLGMSGEVLSNEQMISYMYNVKN